jgi:hypothetical protein
MDTVSARDSLRKRQVRPNDYCLQITNHTQPSGAVRFLYALPILQAPLILYALPIPQTLQIL